MDVVKLPKKVRMVCYEIMDGKEGAIGHAGILCR